MEFDAIVIGGGLAGTATAYYLAKAGVGTLLLERGDLNTQASGSNAGSLHAQIAYEPFSLQGDEWAREFAPVIRLLKESIEIWRGLPQELGADLEVSLQGGLIVARTAAEMRMLERKAALERSVGLEVELLSRADLLVRAPYLAESIIGGTFCAIEGKANPLRAAPAFAAAAERLGARIERRAEVVGISRRERGGFEVTTLRGTFSAGRVVNAAGVDAGTIARMLGVELNVYGEAIQVSVTEPVEPLVPHLVYCAWEKLSLKQTALGTILIGGGWPADRDARGRPLVNADSLANNLAVALNVVPSLASAKIARTWAAEVNGNDSWKPMIGEVPGVPGFYVNFFPWLGFTGGPIAARSVAELIAAAR